MQRTETSGTASLGVHHVGKVIASCNSIFHLVHQENDVGNDGFIEFTINREPDQGGNQAGETRRGLLIPFASILDGAFTPGMAIELNEANFQSEVIDSDLPVLVDFWSEHCGPCKQLLPVLYQLADEVAGWAKVGKMDAVANLSVSSRYGVRSVPNLLFFKNGEVKEQFIGANITKDQLRAKLEALR